MKRIWKIFLMIGIAAVFCCACDKKGEREESKPTDRPELSRLTDELADKQSPYCNNRNLYQCNDGRIVQYTLDGNEMQSFAVEKDFILLYVNDRELIVLNDEESLCSIPIRMEGDKDVLDTEGMTELLLLSDGSTSGYIWPGYLYADEKFLVYITNDYSFRVFDREKGRYVPIENQKVRCQFFGLSILNCTDGEYVVFHTVPYHTGYPENRKKTSNGLCLYRLGDDHVTSIEEDFSASSPFLLWGTEQKVLFVDAAKNGQGDMVWGYDCKEKKKESLITAQMIQQSLQRAGEQDAESGSSASVVINGLYLDGDTLYMDSFSDDGPLFLRYELKEHGEVETLSALQANVEKTQKGLVTDGVRANDLSVSFAFAEGRCLMNAEIYYKNGVGGKQPSENEAEREAEVVNHYISLDPGGEEYHEISDGDTEMSLFQKVGLWME